ncbi:hypothetical protein BH11MYX1_BH11MYX1_04520 [soil metagenome]
MNDPKPGTGQRSTKGALHERVVLTRPPRDPHDRTQHHVNRMARRQLWPSTVRSIVASTRLLATGALALTTALRGFLSKDRLRVARLRRSPHLNRAILDSNEDRRKRETTCLARAYVLVKVRIVFSLRLTPRTLSASSTAYRTHRTFRPRSGSRSRSQINPTRSDQLTKLLHRCLKLVDRFRSTRFMRSMTPGGSRTFDRTRRWRDVRAVDEARARRRRHGRRHDRARGAAQPVNRPNGSFHGIDFAPPRLEVAEHDQLLLVAERAGFALHQAGYRGPFGIDAFVYGTGFERRSTRCARSARAIRSVMPRGTSVGGSMSRGSGRIRTCRPMVARCSSTKLARWRG